MEKLKLEKSKRAQSQFIIVVVVTGLSVALISSVFVIFSEIKDKNELISRDNQLDTLGEKITSSIVEVYTVGENMYYNETAYKLLYSTNVIIPEDYTKYIIKSEFGNIVITHQNKKKEINMHNLVNIEIKGTVVGKNKITIAYYKNQTNRSIEIS